MFESKNNKQEHQIIINKKDNKYLAMEGMIRNIEGAEKRKDHVLEDLIYKGLIEYLQYHKALINK